MHEGSTVPASVIPASAWGLSGRALTADEIAAADPFAGLGVRLDIPPGVEATVEDVVAATGCEHVVMFPGCAWVERYYNCGDVIFAWNSWLARPRKR